jgi:UDP-3-O-[3-hydroxymyristoyl] glucosamine N-acyltransferase
MFVTALEIAQLINGRVVGDPNIKVSGPNKIEEAKEGSIAFLANPKYEPYVYTTEASVLLVNEAFEPAHPIQSTLIKVTDVYSALGVLLNHFQSQNGIPEGSSEMAFIHNQTTVDPSASIGAFSVIKQGVKIGKKTVIFDQVYIGENVKIGDHTIIHPGVKIYRDTEIGDHCILHSNAVIGSDGFGYALSPEGSYEKIAQIGKVILEDNVEIGANTVIDRATMGATIIRKGVKLDNLIQIAHNVEIGSDTVIAAQAGIAGSTKIGKKVQIGGQSGFVGHIQIADGAKIQAKSGVTNTIKKENARIQGAPAFEYGAYLKSYVLFRQLPELSKKIRQLEKELAQLRSESAE